MRFSDSEKVWMVGAIAAGRAGKINHSCVKGAISFSADVLQKVFGDDYKKRIASILEIVDDYYCPTFVEGVKVVKGITMAYRFRKEAIQLAIVSIKETPQIFRASSAAGKKKPQGDMRELTNRKILEKIVADNDVKNPESWISAASILAAMDEEGRVYSDYRRAGGKYGRRFAIGPSLQNLPKDIRRRIMVDTTDIDMVNAHPVIFQALARKYEIDTFGLDQYTERREMVLKENSEFFGVERDASKTLFLMVGYGALLHLMGLNTAFGEWLVEHKVRLPAPVKGKINLPASLSDFRDDMEAVKEAMKGDEMFSMFKDAPSRSRASLCIQWIEDEILSFMQAFFADKGRYVSCLLFDGLHIDGTITKELVAECEAAIAAWAPGKFGFEIKMKLATRYYDN